AHRRRPGGADPAPALPGGPAAAGHPRPARVLGAHLAGGAHGNEGALPEAYVAGGPLGRPAHPQGKAAALTGGLYAAPRADHPSAAGRHALTSLRRRRTDTFRHRGAAPRTTHVTRPMSRFDSLQ